MILLYPARALSFFTQNSTCQNASQSSKTCSVTNTYPNVFNSNISGMINATNSINISFEFNGANYTEYSNQTFLALWLPFQESSGNSSIDRSIYSNNATFSPTAAAGNVTWGKGPYGLQALRFNDTFGTLNVTTKSQYNASMYGCIGSPCGSGGGITITGWINQTASVNTQVIIQRLISNPSAGWNVQVTPSGRIQLNVRNSSNLNNVQGAGIQNNSWIWFATTYDNSTLRMYYNGTQNATSSCIGCLNDTGASISTIIGGNVFNINSSTLNGSIADLRFYTKALNSSEIRNLFCSYVGGCNLGFVYALPSSNSTVYFWNLTDPGAGNFSFKYYAFNVTNGVNISDIPVNITITPNIFSNRTNLKIIFTNIRSNLFPKAGILKISSIIITLQSYVYKRMNSLIAALINAIGDFATRIQKINQIFILKNTILNSVTKVYPSILQTKNCAVTLSSSGTCAFASNVKKDSVLVVGVTDSVSTIGVNTITDSFGNSYDKIISQNTATAAGDTELYYTLTDFAGADTVTVNFGGSVNANIILYELANASDVFPLSSSGNSALASSSAVSSYIPNPSSLVVGVLDSACIGGCSVTAGTGYTLDNNANIGATLQSSSETGNNTGIAETTPFSFSSNSAYNEVSAAFQFRMTPPTENTVFQAIVLAVANIINNLITRTKFIIQTLILQNIGSQTSVVGRIIAQTFAFTNLISKTIIAIRNVVQSISLSNIIFTSIRTLRTSIQQITLTNIATKLGAMFSKAISQSISFINAISQQVANGRIAIQKITFTNFISKSQILLRTLFQQVTFNNFVTRIAMLFKLNILQITFTNITTSLKGFIRTAMQQIIFVNVASRFLATFRVTIQQIILTNIVSIISNVTHNVTNLLQIVFTNIIRTIYFCQFGSTCPSGGGGGGITAAQGKINVCFPLVSVYGKIPENYLCTDTSANWFMLRANNQPFVNGLGNIFIKQGE